MSLFDGIGDIVSKAVSALVTAYAGPVFGPLAGSLVDSLLNDSGSSGSSFVDNAFRQFFPAAFTGTGG